MIQVEFRLHFYGDASIHIDGYEPIKTSKQVIHDIFFTGLGKRVANQYVNDCTIFLIGPKQVQTIMNKTKKEVTWDSDRELALQYIVERGYTSHSSFKRYIKGEAPSPFISSKAQIFGKELHSRFLEGKKLEKLDPADELLMKKMIAALEKNSLVKRIMLGCKVEEEFKEDIFGVPFLGYLDIHKKKIHVADLKTTKCTNKQALADSLDFLQVAIYMHAKKVKEFYYIGITKAIEPKVIVFSVHDFPEKLKAAKKELKRWCAILKKDLKKK